MFAMHLEGERIEEGRKVKRKIKGGKEVQGKTRSAHTDLTESRIKDQRGIKTCSTSSSSCDF